MRGARGTPFTDLGTFASLNDAARVILENEGDPLGPLFLCVSVAPLTFGEWTDADIRGTQALKLTAFFVYSRDLGAHAITEIIVNSSSKSLTDPSQVYALRWASGRRAGKIEFAPAYTIVAR